MNEGDESAFKLGPAASVDGGRRESLPDDGLANVGSDKERDTRAKTVAFLEQLVEENDNESRNQELNDQQQAHASS